jgi:hypothetical protein
MIQPRSVWSRTVQLESQWTLERAKQLHKFNPLIHIYTTKVY